MNTPKVGDKVLWVPKNRRGVVIRQQGSCSRVEFENGDRFYIHYSTLKVQEEGEE